jgi:alkaline phosphatase D
MKIKNCCPISKVEDEPENEKNLRIPIPINRRRLASLFLIGYFYLQIVKKGFRVKFFISPAVSILFMYSFLFAQPAALRSGPMVGYGQMTEVMLWVQTTKPVAVQYLYWDTSGPNDKQKSISITTSEAEAYTARTVISGLQPGRSYGYELLIEGKPVKRNYPLRFQTQSNRQWRTDPSDFTAAFGSCAYVNEKGYDRPGREYGGDYKIFAAIASKQPDLFLWEATMSTIAKGIGTHDPV